jgi:hypothetical protein
MWCSFVRTAAAQHKLEFLCSCAGGPGRKSEAGGWEVNCSVFRCLLFDFSSVCYVGRRFVVVSVGLRARATTLARCVWYVTPCLRAVLSVL